MKELIYELPEEELKVKTNNTVMDATFSCQTKPEEILVCTGFEHYE